jgi:hypothetical protein
MSGSRLTARRSRHAAVGAAAVLWAVGTALVQSPAAQADPDLVMTGAGDRASAEKTIAIGYVEKQYACTPDLAANLEAITWDNPPGFVSGRGGTGMITDADDRLGGQFAAQYVAGRWEISYLYC